jgi:hypothetical protein
MVDNNRALHFIYKHPLFGKRTKTQSGIRFDRSVYYLWFAYLRRNEKYKAYCETKKGTKTIAKLYKDFGDIYSVEFKMWWRETGRWLFCEQGDLERVEEITSTKEFRKYDSDNVLTLAIPINKNVGWLKQQISNKISLKREEYGAGSRETASTSIYPLHTTPDIPSLIKALRVWDEYTEGNKQRKLKGERTRSLVEVAIALDRENEEKEEYDDIGGIGDESKRQLVWRLNKTATLLIENVGKGNFPQHNVRG